MVEKPKYNITHVQDNTVLGGYLGYFDPYIGEAVVKNGLPRRVDRHIRGHMENHFGEFARSGRKKELKVTVVTGIKDPLGFAATIFYNLKPSRIKFYTELARGKVSKPPIYEIFKRKRKQ